MRKLLCAIIVGTQLLSLVACGDSMDSTPSLPPAQEGTVTTPSSPEEFISEDEKLAHELEERLANGICAVEDIQNMYRNGEISDKILYILGIEVPPAQPEYFGDKQSNIKTVSLAACNNHIAGLRADGTVITGGRDIRGSCDVSDWTNIIAIAAGSHNTAGLKEDGSVVVVGENINNQCNVGNWTDVTAISVGDNHVVGLKSDGTVVATRQNVFGQCNVRDWTDIVAISAGNLWTIGLKADGTLVATTGRNRSGQCNVGNLKDIVAISTAVGHTFALKSDGTVVAVGRNNEGQCDVDTWSDIVAIAAGTNKSFGLKKDGTVLSTKYKGYSSSEDIDVSDWSDILIPY